MCIKCVLKSQQSCQHMHNMPLGNFHWATVESRQQVTCVCQQTL
jgi:hypothetical protein